MKNKLYALLIASTSLLYTSCSNEKDAGEISTPTRGHVKISVDESFQPIIETQVSTFEGIYKYATIEAGYKPEGSVIRDLLNDSTRIAVLSRELTPDETAAFDKQKRIARTTKFAIDAVALIVNKNNKDTLLTLEQVRNIFQGKHKAWKEISSNSTLGNITIVFDNNNSSTARYVKDSLTTNQQLPPNTYASQSHSALIDYVAQNENAVGVIGVNWISDFDDNAVRGFLDKVNIIGISTSSNPTSNDEYYQPYQAYIAQAAYPLRRFLYVINMEGRAGLGTGFASYVAGDKGQRIILKSGLVPATMPVRVVGLQ